MYLDNRSTRRFSAPLAVFLTLAFVSCGSGETSGKESEEEEGEAVESEDEGGREGGGEAEAESESEDERECLSGMTQPCGSDVGACVAGLQTCDLTGFWTECIGSVEPAVETCDGTDNDCNGEIDDILPEICGSDTGECQTGERICGDGQWSDCVGEILPRAEDCDGLDNDCNGVADDDLLPQSRECSAGRGECRRFGLEYQVCLGETGWSEYRDCDAVAAEPSEEVCDGLDNDCTGAVDDNLAAPWRECSSGVGECQRDGREFQVCEGPAGWSSDFRNCNAVESAPVDEFENGLDDNCDGFADNDLWLDMESEGAPQGRSEHTAVWTGSEMLIWGGNVVRGSSARGGKYNPIENRWLPMSDSGLTESRFGHTAVWTGSEMIVLGGQGGSLRHDGGRYDPVADAWQIIGPDMAPGSGFQSHTAVWTGSEMIVYGGLGLYSQTSGNGLRYNPASNEWTVLVPEGVSDRARYDHTAVWTGSEMVVWGGRREDSVWDFARFDTGFRYNPSSGNWAETSVANAPSPRFWHKAVWTGGEMIVWGGIYGYAPTRNTGGKYNPSTGEWLPITPTDEGRRWHSFVWTGSEAIVWGGQTVREEGWPRSTTHNSGMGYDPLTDLWSGINITYAPSPRTRHTAVWTGSEMIIWGGYDYLNDGGRYRP